MTPDDRQPMATGAAAPPPGQPSACDPASRRFTRAQRLRRRQDYQRVYEQGSRLSGLLMTVFLLPNALGQARLGIAATRKIGPAVGRNRAKRRVREVFRHHRPPEALDIVVIPRKELITAPAQRVEAEFRGLLGRHRRRSRA